jgi:hypothetical protein
VSRDQVRHFLSYPAHVPSYTALTQSFTPLDTDSARPNLVCRVNATSTSTWSIAISCTLRPNKSSNQRKGNYTQVSILQTYQLHDLKKEGFWLLQGITAWTVPGYCTNRTCSVIGTSATRPALAKFREYYSQRRVLILLVIVPFFFGKALGSLLVARCSSSCKKI